MASKATKITIPVNMHIDSSVTPVSCIKSEVKFDLEGL